MLRMLYRKEFRVFKYVMILNVMIIQLSFQNSVPKEITSYLVKCELQIPAGVMTLISKYIFPWTSLNIRHTNCYFVIYSELELILKMR
jgi:hypothetical protein